MRIALASTCVPFALDPRLDLLEGLARALRRLGHDVEFLRLPVPPLHSSSVLSHILALRMLEVTESFATPIERLVALDLPACALPHPSKIAWLLPSAPHWDMKEDPVPDELREGLSHFLCECQALYASSASLAAYLWEYTQREVSVLYPPASEQARPEGRDGKEKPEYRAGSPTGPIYCRPTNRFSTERALEVVQLLRPERRVLLVDPPTATEILTTLRLRNLETRVELITNSSAERRSALFREICAVLIPEGGDAVSPVLSALVASRPVVAPRGAGEELVRDGINGLLTGPSPVELRDALHRLADDRSLNERLCRGAWASADYLQLGWSNITTKLLA